MAWLQLLFQLTQWRCHLGFMLCTQMEHRVSLPALSSNRASVLPCGGQPHCILISLWAYTWEVWGPPGHVS